MIIISKTVILIVCMFTLGCAQMQQGVEFGKSIGLTVGGAIGVDETYVKVGIQPQVTAEWVKGLFGSDYGPEPVPAP